MNWLPMLAFRWQWVRRDGRRIVVGGDDTHGLVLQQAWGPEDGLPSEWRDIALTWADEPRYELTDAGREALGRGK